MSLWKKLAHLVPSIRRADDDDMRRELAALKEMAEPGELGNLTLAAEDAREVNRWMWFERLRQDLRYAFRSMWHDKVFASLAVASLALGIGASTAIYSFADALLVRPLPVSKPQSLIALKWFAKTTKIASDGIAVDSSSTFDANGRLSAHFPYPALQVFDGSRDILSSAFAYDAASGLSVSVGNETVEADGQFVSGNYFDSLGIAPSAGRLIQRADDKSGSAGVAVISRRFGDRRFGAADRAVGQTMRVNDRAFAIVGVAPAGFFGVEPGAVPDLYMPMRAQLILEQDSERSLFQSEHYYWMKIMARLQPGVSIDDANATLSSRFHQFVLNSATTDAQRQDLPTLRLQSGASGLDSLRRKFAQPIYILIAIVGVILLIACSNLANLLLARASARRREIAIRLSVGASRRRVIRQLLTESLLLSSIGGSIGLALAWWSIPVLTRLLSNGRENFSLHAALDGRVLFATLLLSGVTGLVFGLVPALQGTRVDIVSNLKAVPAGDAARRHRRIAPSHGLVVAQIALSLVMLVGAGLLGRTLANLHGINVGFNRENVLLFTINPGALDYKGDARNQLFENLRSQLKGLPGVQSASLSSQPLPMGGGTAFRASILGAPAPMIDGAPPFAIANSVGPGFFSTMQIPLKAGREFVDSDRRGGPKVVIVNRQFATAFGLENPIGQIAILGGVQYNIVGLVDDALSLALKDEMRPAVFLPYLQTDRVASAMTYEVRTSGRPANFFPMVIAAVRGVDWRLAVNDLTTLSAHIDRGISQEITLATLCSTFAGVALLIACVGLYGTVAFNVARRTNEIGIRMALGASGARIIWMVLRDVVVMAVAGFALGIPLVWASTKYVSSFLYGIEPHDPRAIAAAVSVLLTCALLAGFAPALRASRIAPMGAVRRD